MSNLTHPDDIDFDRDGQPSEFVPPPADHLSRLADDGSDAMFKACQEELDDQYEESVRASYAARGYHNIY